MKVKLRARWSESSVREVRADLGLAHVVDPSKSDPLELNDVVHLEGRDERFAEAPFCLRRWRIGCVRQDQMDIDPVSNPLDLGDIPVLHRDESRTVVQDDVAEVLEPHLFPAELLEVL